VFNPKRTAKMRAKRGGERRVFGQRIPRVAGTRKISDTIELSEWERVARVADSSNSRVFASLADE
jgi:hypothetical protein